MQEVKKPPYTTRRGNIWQYHRRVSPKALIPIIGFAEYRESLQTPDIEIARTRAAIRNAVVEVELQAAKAELKRQQGISPLVHTNLSPESLRFIREAVVAHTLQADEEFRRSRPDENGREAYDLLISMQS